MSTVAFVATVWTVIVIALCVANHRARRSVPEVAPRPESALWECSDGVTRTEAAVHDWLRGPAPDDDAAWLAPWEFVDEDQPSVPLTWAERDRFEDIMREFA